jgi:hypothetical protein
MLHVDAKKFARIEAVGHRIHGDRSRRHYSAGWEVVFVSVDDHAWPTPRSSPARSAVTRWRSWAELYATSRAWACTASAC